MEIKESISACIAQKDEIAKVVLMPGDPLRAKAVADNYMTDVVCFNDTRNMLGFTGTYKGKRISVMGSGMGIPSMCLYAHELYTQFGVDAII
ncbi:MAG: purine-nucleoside phosphorylase, partial [Firmicutes bacterium]|nr:purine-nucleoside phosphorylase [Bacillota bacterium]